MRGVVSGCLLSVVAAGCSVTNSADVCSSNAPAPVGVNQLRDGKQELQTPHALTVLPSGETLVMFGAEVGDSANPSIETRSIRLTAANAPAEGCFVRDQREQVLPVTFINPVPSRQAIRVADLLPAPTAAGEASNGLVLFTAQAETGVPTLGAIVLPAPGCFLPGLTPVPVSATATAAGRTLVAADTGPRLVRLPDQAEAQRYLVLWTEASTTTLQYKVMARVLRAIGGEIEMVPTAPAPDGSPTELALPGGTFKFGLDALLTGANEIVVVWAAGSSVDEFAIYSRRFDLQLNPQEEAAVLASHLALGDLTTVPRLSAAFDKKQMLLVWMEGQSDGTTRARARAFRPDGRTAGPAVTLGDAPTANDRLVTVAAWPTGGFVAAWRQALNSGGDEAVSLRLVALDSYGRKVFTNHACGESDFPLATGGDVGRASLAVAADQRVLVAYTASGAGTAGLSQSDVELLSFAARDLFPGGALRATTTAPGELGPAPTHYAATHPSCAGPMAGLPSRSCKCDETCDFGAIVSPRRRAAPPAASAVSPAIPRRTTAPAALTASRGTPATGAARLTAW